MRRKIHMVSGAQNNTPAFSIKIITDWIVLSLSEPKYHFALLYNNQDTKGFLRVSRSRNPENIRNPLIFLRKMAAFSCFAETQSRVFSCRHEIHDLLTLIS